MNGKYIGPLLTTAYIFSAVATFYYLYKALFLPYEMANLLKAFCFGVVFATLTEVADNYLRRP